MKILRISHIGVAPKDPQISLDFFGKLGIGRTETLHTQKIVKTSFTNDKEKVIIIKKCSEPIAQVLEIYQATKYKQKPFSMKKFVLPQ